MCRFIVRAMVVLYLVALALFVVGTFGLFGAAQDPISGVFLIPMGWPWFLLVENAPEFSWPWLTAAAPILNILVVSAACRRLMRR